jgi:hypothetical protein
MCDLLKLAESERNYVYSCCPWTRKGYDLNFYYRLRGRIMVYTCLCPRLSYLIYLGTMFSHSTKGLG